jgi:hypothetical protein
MRSGRQPDAVIPAKTSPLRRWPDWVPELHGARDGQENLQPCGMNTANVGAHPNGTVVQRLPLC